MKNFFVILGILQFLVTNNIFGQKVCKTEFSLGLNNSRSTISETYWEAPRPDNLIFNAAKSWYNNQHMISLRKELGLDLQYSNLRCGRGNLVESNKFQGNNFSLYANTALLARFRVSGKLSFSLGPEIEILLIGINNLKKSYQSSSIYPLISGIIYESSVNRNYFNQPSYGIKAYMFESEITERVTFGIAFSYLWTKAEYSNFYASNYTRISFLVGLKHKKDITQKKFE